MSFVSSSGVGARPSGTPTSSPGLSRPSGNHLRPLALQQCGKYTLVAKLGHGGMAEVFLALADGIAGFQKLAVIKRLHTALVYEQDFLVMFLDEARLAGRLSHPNVVETYDIGDTDGIPFLAMQHLEGQSLDIIRRFLSRRQHRIPPPIVAQIGVQILAGLHYAHELADFDGKPLGVVHRDVSPSNMFLTYQGTVKLLDFGIAKATTKLAQTRVGQIKGKLSYMAPEQTRGTDVDRRADLWSVGVSLFELSTGRSLFKTSTDVETLNELLAGDIDEKLNAVEADLPPPLMQAIRGALQRDPKDRWQTAEEMAACLKPLAVTPEGAGLEQFAGRLLGAAVEKQRAAVSELLQNAQAQRKPKVLASPLVVAPSLDPEPGSIPSVVAPRPSGFLYTGAIILAACILGALAAIVMTQQGDATDPPPLAGPVMAGGASERDEAEPLGVDAGPAVVYGEEPASVDAGTSVLAEEASSVPPTPATSRRRVRPRDRDEGALGALRAGERSRDEPDAPSSSETRGERPAAATGNLTLLTVPWSEVLLRGRSLGTTPLRNVTLPAGDHVLTLRNPEIGLETTVHVSIPANGTVTRRLGLR